MEWNVYLGWIECMDENVLQEQIYVVVGNCVYFGIEHLYIGTTYLENLFLCSYERESQFIGLK